MAYVLPAISDFKAQFLRDFSPYAVPLSGGGSGATITPVLGGVNNGLAGVTLDAGGANYPANVLPTVIVYGGGGIGAAVTITVVAGAVATAVLSDAGYGYDQQLLPVVYVSNGLGDDTDEKKVTDYDIVAAFNAARAFNMTQSLLPSQQTFTYAYNLLTAHYLCENLQAAGLGLGGKAEWVTNSKTVGNVTESYSIPDRILKSPYLSKISKTTYGAQFLELMSPQLIGNMQSYHRSALPA